MNYDEHVECLDVWVFFRCMITMYASLLQSILFHFLCMHILMGLVSHLANGMVASSSPIEGLGMLHIGIKAHVVVRASNGHEESASRYRFPSAQQKPKEIREMIGNFNKNFLSVGNIGQLRMKPTRYIEGLSQKLLQGGNLFLLTSCNQ